MNTALYLLNKYGPSPNPDMPHVIAGTLRQNLYQLFAQLGFKVGAEIGVFRGENARNMFREIPGLKLHGVEPYADQPYSTRLRTPERYNQLKAMAFDRLKNQNFILIEKFSEDAIKDIPYSSLDFVYIDGDHSYDYVMTDIILWARRVHPGGIISGHDYTVMEKNRNKPDINVQQAVDDYISIHKISPWYLTDTKTAVDESDKCASWFFVKS